MNTENAHRAISALIIELIGLLRVYDIQYCCVSAYVLVPTKYREYLRDKCPRVEECIEAEVLASEDCSSSERQIANIPHYWQ